MHGPTTRRARAAAEGLPRGEVGSTVRAWTVARVDARRLVYPALREERVRCWSCSAGGGAGSIVKLAFCYSYRSASSGPSSRCWASRVLYRVLNLILSWFALANYCCAQKVLTKAMQDRQYGVHGVKSSSSRLARPLRLALARQPARTGLIDFVLVKCFMTFAAFFLAFKGVKEAEGQARNARRHRHLSQRLLPRYGYLSAGHH